jgi:hypothetical protein
MTDIVERLLDPSKGSPRWLDTMNDAAIEIEWLRKIVNHQAELLQLNPEQEARAAVGRKITEGRA